MIFFKLYSTLKCHTDSGASIGKKHTNELAKTPTTNGSPKESRDGERGDRGGGDGREEFLIVEYLSNKHEAQIHRAVHAD